MPSKGEGEGAGEGEGMALSSSCATAGVIVVVLGRWLGDCGGVSTSNAAELLVLVLLACLDGDDGTPRLLVGLAKGLAGRSAPRFWLI